MWRPLPQIFSVVAKENPRGVAVLDENVSIDLLFPHSLEFVNPFFQSRVWHRARFCRDPGAGCFPRAGIQNFGTRFSIDAGTLFKSIKTLADYYPEEYSREESDRSQWPI